MIDRSDILKGWQDECSSAAVYQALAETEKDTRLADVYRRMADAERQHARKWEEKAQDAGMKLPVFLPDLRTRALIWMGRRFGAGTVLPSMQYREVDGGLDYLNQPDGMAMAGEERGHSRLLSQITRGTRGGFEGSVLAQLEGRHRATGGNALRAAVLGANDGMVSNLSLVMGVAGAALDNRTILITGLAGMLAGAISMALGEWLSVQSSRELYSHQIAIETAEIDQSPEEEVEELALIYEARGLEREQAQSMAAQILSNREYAIETLAREELGIDPKELGGSAWEAALTSFFLFTLGAIVPVIAFTFLSGWQAVLASIIFSTGGLFIIGVATSFFTGRSFLYSGGRMVLFGLAAAAVTFGIGKLVGVSIGG